MQIYIADLNVSVITLSAQSVSTVVLKQRGQQRFKRCETVGDDQPYSESSGEETYSLFGASTRPFFSFNPAETRSKNPTVILCI